MLTQQAKTVYAEKALAESSAGIGVPILLGGHRHQSGFFVRDVSSMGRLYGVPSGTPFPSSGTPTRTVHPPLIGVRTGGFQTITRKHQMSENTISASALFMPYSWFINPYGETPVSHPVLANYLDAIRGSRVVIEILIQNRLIHLFNKDTDNGDREKPLLKSNDEEALIMLCRSTLNLVEEDLFRLVYHTNSQKETSHGTHQD